MGFKEYFLAQEFELKGVKAIMANPIIPCAIAKKGGAKNMKFWIAPKFQSPFRLGKSLIKSKKS
jgi:hypothetical protein